MVTESLSLMHQLTHGAVVAAWLFIATLLTGLLLLAGRFRPFQSTVQTTGFETVRRSIAHVTLEMRIAFAFICSILLLLALIGWLYAPSNGDSMVYHLARVSHWSQERSVAHFATHYLAQIELAPLHEFNMLHLHLLSGTDRLDGYPQFLAFVVCIVAASELARLLGGDSRAQTLAAVTCAVIPSTILEATSTQNNLFAASISVALFVLLLSWNGSPPWVGRAVLLGLAGGLAILTKGTLLALLGPAVLLLGGSAALAEFRQRPPLAALRRIAAVSVVVVSTATAIALPFVHRNYDLFDAPIGPVSESTRVQDLTVQPAAANIVRSTAVNFMMGNGKDGIATFFSQAVLSNLARLYRLTDVDPDDQRFVLGTTTDAFAKRDYRGFNRYEDYGANPWHVLLLTFSGVLICYRAVRGDRTLRQAALLAVGLALGFIAFSATARWSVYVTRYQEPLLVAWAPLIAIALNRLPRLIGRVVIVLLIVACLPQLLDNESRSLLHPRYHYSSDLDSYLPGLGGTKDSRIADYLAVRTRSWHRSCDRVGIANWILVEYPIWAGLEHAGWDGTIEHVNVSNESRRLEDERFQPCALLREVGTDYVPEDTDRVELRYGILSLSIDPDRVGAAQSVG